MTSTKLSLADYLSLEDGTDSYQEFVDGQIIEMPPESSQNVLISLYLLVQFLKFIPITRLRHKDTEIVVSGRVRLPDLMVLSDELSDRLQSARRSTITEEMPPPVLVVEVVSPGKVNEDRDYRFKRSEYAARGILEYWIVDPLKEKVTVLRLVDGLYEVVEYAGNQRLESLTFPELELTVEQIWRAGK